MRNKEGNSSIDIAISGKHKQICLYFGQSDKYRNFIKSNHLDEIIENITGEKIPDLDERPNFELNRHSKKQMKTKKKRK